MLGVMRSLRRLRAKAQRRLCDGQIKMAGSAGIGDRQAGLVQHITLQL